MKILCKNIPWESLFFVTLSAFISLSLEEEEAEGQLPEKQLPSRRAQEVLFAFSVLTVLSVADAVFSCWL